ncbi:hypothetical protein H106_04153 [Trichophyton rubrum CBS 735.88]|nr:hypothetical protein H106_04153 [Trichophyton rubrum CBS 735.88]
MARDGRSQPLGLGLPCSMSKSDPPVQPMQHSVSSIWTNWDSDSGLVILWQSQKQQQTRGWNEEASEREREMSWIRALHLWRISLLLRFSSLCWCFFFFFFFFFFFAVLRHPRPLPALARDSSESWSLSRSPFSLLASWISFRGHLRPSSGSGKFFFLSCFRPEVTYPDVRGLASSLVSGSLPSSACVLVCVFRHVRPLPSIVFARASFFYKGRLSSASSSLFSLLPFFPPSSSSPFFPPAW